MTALSTDVRVPRARRGQDHPVGPYGTAALSALRDEVMAEHLRTATGDGAPDLHEAYRARWWDGGAWSPVLELEWRGTRWRVLRDDDELVCLPWRTGRARRLLRRRRRTPVTAPLAPLLRSVVLPREEQPAVELLEPGDARGLAALRREHLRRLTAGPGPGVDPRQGVLRFEPDEPAPAPPRTSAARVLVVQQAGDWTACRHPACGGLTLLPAPGLAAGDDVCPSCRRR